MLSSFPYFIPIVALLMLMFLLCFPCSSLLDFIKYDRREMTCISKQRSYLFGIYESYIFELRFKTNRGLRSSHSCERYLSGNERKNE